MTVAVFSYRDWTALYPQFGPGGANFVSEPAANLYFGQAALYCANDDCAIIPADPTTFGPRISILYMLTTHLAALSSVTQTGAAGLVGRISDASEGSVSVKLDLGALPDSASWYAQTPWGLQAYTAMAPYRQARYIPSPGRFAQGVGWGGPYNGRPYYPNGLAGRGW